MIRYRSDLFGLRTLLVWNGSAAFRAVVPASVSTGLVLVYAAYAQDEIRNIVLNSYTITVLVAFFSYLLTTRLNFSYTRWWEAATQCHFMTSKFTDSAVCLASFHYQATFWNPLKPETFGHEYAGNAQGKRGKSHVTSAKQPEDVVLLGKSLEPTRTAEEMAAAVAAAIAAEEKSSKRGLLSWLNRLVPRRNSPSKSGGGSNITTTTPTSPPPTNANINNNVQTSTTTSPSTKHKIKRSASAPILATKSFKPNRKEQIKRHESEHHDQTIAVVTQEPPVIFEPSGFLEEAVHLYSLLNAVAMASLRHDVEGCPSPLAEYIPNRPLPPYNPDHFQHRHGHLMVENNDNSESKEEESWLRNRWNETVDGFWSCLYFLAGLNRSPKQRTLYNAARPFHVLGGVSEEEAQRLKLARGPVAQVALCQLWLKEFISREHLQGSTGDVGPPIVGRVLHFMSDGMLAYNQCRKVAYIPFPFPHEQMTNLFTFLVVFFFPILYVGFVNSILLACALNFTTMLCFQGIYEVARELSNPYHTVPNDLPLNRFHAQFNESLRILLTGYHPNWKVATITDSNGD